MKIFLMCLTVFLTSTFNLCAQKKENIPINQLFSGIKFTTTQDSLIRDYYHEIREQPYPRLMNNINWYAFTLLNNKQKTKYDKSEAVEVERMVLNYFSKYELSQNQIEQVTQYFKSLDKRKLYGEKYKLVSSYIKSIVTSDQSIRTADFEINKKKKKLVIRFN